MKIRADKMSRFHQTISFLYFQWTSPAARSHKEMDLCDKLIVHIKNYTIYYCNMAVKQYLFNM